MSPSLNTMTYVRVRPDGPRILCLGVAALMSAVALPAAAQEAGSPTAAKPAASAEDLAERVRQLESENAALQRKVWDLQAQLERFRGTANDDSTEAAPLDPYASPASLLRELKRRYARQLNDLPRSTQSQRERFEAQARHWCEKTQNEVRGRTRWLALVTDVRTPDRGSPDALIRVLDEFTHKPLGDAVRVPITRTMAERFTSIRREFELRHDRTPTSESSQLAYQINTLVIATPEFNAERQDVGVFDVPPFIGPCVEFGMKLDIDTVAAVELSRETPKPALKPATDPDAARPPR